MENISLGLTMAKAQPGDLEKYITLLEEVGEWLHSRNRSPLPKGIYMLSKDYFSDSIAKQEVHLALSDTKLVGAVRLVPNDGVVWTPRSPDPALYVENLVVSRRFSSLGFGRAILAWAERQAVARGKDQVRLDCFASNEILRDYYEQLGYTGMGEVDAHYPFGVLRLQRYEKPL